MFGRQPPHPPTFGRDLPKKTVFFWQPPLSSFFHINPDWRLIFEKSAPFELKKNALLTTLPKLHRQWMVEFEFKPTKYTNHSDSSDSGWTSIFQMFAHQRFYQQMFYRPPDVLHICSNINENEFCQDYPSPRIGNWTPIKISRELVGKKFSKYRIFILAFNLWRLRSSTKLQKLNQ